MHSILIIKAAIRRAKSGRIVTLMEESHAERARLDINETYARRSP